MVPDWLKTFVGLEGLAESEFVFEPIIIPGLLQTEEYAAAGTVNLLKLSGSTGMVGSAVGLCGLGQAAVAVPVTSFQVVNRPAISRRYSSAPSRWRRGRKCGEMPLNADKNRCACPDEVNRFMARSR